MDMTHEKSCGAVVYARTAKGVRFALVHSRNGYWSFPKGHVEAEETERETAAREVWEETGLRVRFVDGFRETDTHRLIRERRPNTVKDVVYFLAECDDPTPCPQDATEVAGVALLDFDSVLSVLRSDEASCRILERALRFIEESPL